MLLIACGADQGRAVQHETSGEDHAPAQGEDSIQPGSVEDEAAPEQATPAPSAPEQAPEASDCEPLTCAGPLASGDRAEAISAAVLSLVGGASPPQLEDMQVQDEGIDIVFVEYLGYFAVIPSAMGSFVCPLGTEYSDSMSASSATAQWIEGGEPETTIDFDASGYDRDEGLSSTYGSTTRWFFGIENGVMLSYGSLTVANYSTDQQWTGCHCEEGEFPARDDCCDDIRATERETRWQVTPRAPSGLRVARVDGTGTAREVDVRSLCGFSRDD